MSESEYSQDDFGNGGLNHQLDVGSLVDEIGLDRSEIEWRKDYVGFGEEDRKRLETYEAAFEDHAEEVADDFYENITNYEETVSILDGSPKGVDQLKRTQSAYLVTLARGEYGREYVRNRARIGKLHDLLEMPMKQYIGTYMLYYNILIPRLADRVIERTTAELDGGEEIIEQEFRQGIEEIMSLLRITNLDMQIATDTYIHSYNRTLSRDLQRRQEASSTIQSSVEEVQDMSSNVARNAGEIAELTEEQSSGAKDIAQEVANLSASIEEVAASSDQVRQTSETAAELAASGQDAAEDGIETMEELDEARKAVSENVADLEEMVQEIDDVAEVIDDVARETNILALNANIEAARAGEAGEGFAVVADEVKSLAEQTQEHASRIEETIQEIQERTESTVESLDVADSRIVEGVDTIESSLDILGDINNAIEETVDGIDEVASATDDQSASTQEIAVMVDQAASNAEEIDAQIDEIARSTEEQAAMVEEIEAALAQLNQKT